MKGLFLILGAIIGAIIGVVIVRNFILVGIEKIYFELMLDAISRGHLDLEQFFRSDTFMKTSIGLVIGGLIGFASVALYERNRKG